MNPQRRGALSHAPITLTERDIAVLDALTHRVKLLPLSQVRRVWWPESTTTREMMRRIAMLEQAGWLMRKTMLGREVGSSPTMLASWNPNELLPDFADVIWRSRRRATSPVEAVHTLVATRAAADLLGGEIRHVRTSEVSHDLRLAAVFAEMKLTRSAWAQAWRGELVLDSRWLAGGDPVPDAVLALPGRPVVVEVVGSSYSTTRMRELHAWCAAKEIGYQLW